MNILKKVAKKVENSKIVKNPKFLVIGLIIIVVLIALIYFIFLKYSPVMNFKYEGYAISGKEITENLLGSGDSDNDVTNANASKNIELTKIEEQGTIFKKLNDYYVGSKEKTEINLNYPIYINGNSSLYNLSEESILISKNFEEIVSYPNLSISEGKIYDGNNLERADAKEYIFVKTSDNIYINLYEIKVTTTANEYTIPINSIIAFTENSIRYYTINNNVLVFNEINDIDNNSNVQIVDNNYTYEELLTRLGILQKENNTENSNEQENIIEENTADNSNANNNEDEDTKNDEQANNTESSNQNNYIKPQVTADNFTAGVYTATSTLHIKDPSGRIIEAPTFEIYIDGKIYLRRTFSNSGTIEITGLVPDTEFRVIGKFTYLNENGQKVENTFYEGTFTTKGYEELGSIDIQKENGEIFSNKIQLTKVKIISDLNAEAIKGINQVEIETGEIRTVLKNNQVNELLQGKEIEIESSEGLKSDSKINYVLKFYDKNGIELKVNNNTGETRTSKEKPIARVTMKEQNIVSVTLRLNLTNKDNVELENYKYIVTRPNGEKVKEERLAENEKEILLEDLDQNQYYKISIYADYDLNDNKGKQENVELGNLVFATQPISTLGSLELVVENKELTSTTSTISYKIDEERTDKRLIQILNELTINIVEQPEGYGDNNNQETKEGTVVYTDTLTGEEITNLQQAGKKEIKYENLKSNTTYTIEITGNVQLGNTQEEIPITYNYKEFTTLKIPAKVEIRNQFVTGNLIDFDVRIEDINNSVLNNTVRMELRNSSNDLIDLQKIATNEDYIRKTYEKLEENKTYKLSFYADQYNEGSTDETYKVNYLIKEIEIVTEPGISGDIGLTELTRKATGKNLVDMSSETKWYVYPNFNTNDYYGKEYNKETKTLRLGGHSNVRRAVYDLREYAGQEVTMSFKAKAVSGSQTAYIQNSKSDTNRTTIQGLSDEWKDFQYTLTIDSTGYLGFYIVGGNGIQVKELQIELGNKKTSYEEFNYILQSDYSINLEDKRDEIPTNDYYIKVYEGNNLIKTDRYEEIPAENIITNAIKTYATQSNKQYKVELVIKIKEREYILSELEYNTQDTEEIKGIYNKEDFLEIQPRGHYIALGDIDLSGGKDSEYKFGNQNIFFEGMIDFNGHRLIRDSLASSQAIFYRTAESSVLMNLNFDIKLNNNIEISYFYGLTQNNYGKIQNIKINLIESNNLPNNRMYLLTYTNYGIIDNFILNFEESLYGSYQLTGLAYANEGSISNGYCYGKNIKAIYHNVQASRDVAAIVVINQSKGNIRNVFSLISVDTEGATGNNTYLSNIVARNSNGARIENIYSVNLGDTYDLTYGPNIYETNSENISNVYYFSDEIFKNMHEQKNTKLALHDYEFQNRLLNNYGNFDISLVEMGFYPWISMPACMPAQEYIQLPEVNDKDLVDILSMEIIETNNKNEAKIKLNVNNPAGETITNIEIKNVDCSIESQTYNEGKSEVIAMIKNPSLYVSEYSILSISTKGTFNSEYKREFKENERLIKIEFYREINTIQEWQAINKSPTENYILMKDLDFKNNSEISLIRTVYTGKLEGNNHTLRNINIENNAYIINQIKNEFRNITFENCKIKNSDVRGIINYSYGKMKNVYAKNIDIEITSNVTTTTLGGLLGVATNGASMENCSMNDVSIKIDTFCTTSRVGGLIGVANWVTVTNCFAQNVNINIKNNTYEGVGGLIGAIESDSLINNCYATGNIDTDGGKIGGLVGLFNAGKLENSYTYIDITGTGEYIAGLVGIGVNSKVAIMNCLSLGNLFTNAKNYFVDRISINGDLVNNFAYDEQRINGDIEDTSDNVILLSIEELVIANTYETILNWENVYNYEEIPQAILPKLNKKDSSELLPNQDDIYINLSNKFTLNSISVEKSAVNRIQGQISIINITKAEVIGIEIEGMQTEVKKIMTDNGITYINFEAIPIEFYDVYKLSNIIYKEDNKNAKEKIEGRIDTQFYKEIYTFEDWQSIQNGTYQNYRIMQDIDFANKNNVNCKITAARLEGANENIKLKNIDVPEDNSLIEAVNLEIKNLKFENIKVKTNKVLSNFGIFSNLKGNINNVSFKSIEIDAKSCSNVGVIGSFVGQANNINLEDININALTYVGGLVGNEKGTIDNVKGKEINITAKDYVGGIVGYSIKDINNIEVETLTINGNNYVGGIVGNIPSGATNFGDFIVREANIVGNAYVGGVEGCIYGYGNSVREIYNSTITGSDSNIGGIAGYTFGAKRSSLKVINCIINQTNLNGENIGGMEGYGSGRLENSYIKNSTINAEGSYVGGIKGKYGNVNGNELYNNYAENIVVKGYSNVGGLTGLFEESAYIRNNYINAEVKAIEGNAGGIVAKLDNTTMTNVSNTSRIYYNYFVGTVYGKTNVGGLIGNIAKELYMPDKFYYGNYVEADLSSTDRSSISLGIGGRPDQNQYLKDTYYYKYSSINGENPNEKNEGFISEDKYLNEEELKQNDTYISKLKWSTSTWNVNVIADDKYPTLKTNKLPNQNGIDLPNDEEHIIRTTQKAIETQEKLPNEQTEQTFKYNNKTIQTYSTYSVITETDGSKITRNAKLYVKDNNLYAIPVVISVGQERNSEEIVPVAKNLILDSYNGKEYETVLGSDGKLYDLKEPIEYPENFVNSDIESIGNNLNSDVKEVEVTYKDGDKIKFNYQTGEVISSSEAEDAQKTGLFDYLKEEISEIGNSNSGVSREITNKYEKSKELQTKLEETSVEEAIEKQNIAKSNEGTEGVTTTENNETNNSLKENKYISVYDEKIDDYLIYNEEELLDTTKEEVVSENEKIKANNLNEYYESEGETKNTKLGIVWIVIIIIGVGITLFVLGKKIGIRGRC